MKREDYENLKGNVFVIVPNMYTVLLAANTFFIFPGKVTSLYVVGKEIHVLDFFA